MEGTERDETGQADDEEAAWVVCSPGMKPVVVRASVMEDEYSPTGASYYLSDYSLERDVGVPVVAPASQPVCLDYLRHAAGGSVAELWPRRVVPAYRAELNLAPEPVRRHHFGACPEAASSAAGHAASRSAHTLA